MTTESSTSLLRTKIIQRRIIVVLLALIVAVAAIGGWIYATTPQAVKAASQAHFHLRMQILVGGKAENFAQGKYQTAYDKDSCSANLTSEPVHFHDGKDQFLHIHWADITGSLLLKNYGWNFAGGPDGYLGLQTSPSKRLVPTHGMVLPPAPSSDQYYIYTGDPTGYQERDWNGFKRQPLDDFMAGKSAMSTNILAWLVPTASAHEAGDDAHAELSEFRGNIVIFAQKDKPSDQQIKARFEKLEPLPESACTG